MHKGQHIWKFLLNHILLWNALLAKNINWKIFKFTSLKSDKTECYSRIWFLFETSNKSLNN